MKLLSTVIVAITVVASLISGCHALKPFSSGISQTNKKSKNVVTSVGADHHLPIMAPPTSNSRQAATSVRGGGGGGDMTKSDVVKLHGMAMVFFGITFLAESLLGIEIPIVGPSAVIPGAANNIMSAICGTHVLGFGLLQMKFCNTPDAQDTFIKYLPLSCVATLYLTNKAGGEGMQYLYGILMGLFSIAAFISK